MHLHSCLTWLLMSSTLSLQPDTTVVVYPGQTAEVDASYNILIRGVSAEYTR